MTNGDIFSFMPRSYDLSEYRQVDLFVEDFHRTAVLNCLKKHAKFFKTVCGDIFKEIEALDASIGNNVFTAERKRKLKR